jgi:hypothetical protein
MLENSEHNYEEGFKKDFKLVSVMGVCVFRGVNRNSKTTQLFETSLSDFLGGSILIGYNRGLQFTSYMVNGNPWYIVEEEKGGRGVYPLPPPPTTYPTYMRARGARGMLGPHPQINIIIFSASGSGSDLGSSTGSDSDRGFSSGTFSDLGFTVVLIMILISALALVLHCK